MLGVTVKIHFLLALAACSAAEESFDPYVPGDYNVNHKTFYSLLTSKLDHNLAVWAPDAAGKYPVLYFNSGLGGLIDANFYSKMFEHISSHGYVIMAPFKYLGFPQSEYTAEWMIELLQWAQENLMPKLLENGFNAGLEIDYETMFLMGHSSGAHIGINYMKLGCHNIKGMVLISPVDGVDPFGFVQDFCITPGEKLPFTVPTLLLTSGYDSVPGINIVGDIIPSCAPPDLSNMRFYEALNGPVWHNNATLFGHVDFMNSDVIPVVIEVSNSATLKHEITQPLYPFSIRIFVLRTLQRPILQTMQSLFLANLLHFSKVLLLPSKF